MRFPSQTIAQAAVIAVIAGSAALANRWIAGPPERFFHCDPAELEPGEVCLRDIPEGGGIVWVDARTREEWKRDGLAGSLLFSLAAGEDKNVFEAEVATRIVETPEVVVYCGGEDCSLSHQVAEMIRGLGLGANVRVLKGGWRALHEAGRITGSN